MKLLATVIASQTEIYDTDCTALGLSQVYWFCVTRLTLHYTSARTLLDLRRYGAVFLGNASSDQRYRDRGVYYAVAVNSTPARSPGIDRFHIYCETASDCVAHCCEEKSGYVRGTDVITASVL